MKSLFDSIKSAFTAGQDGHFKYRIDDNELIVTKYVGSEGSVTIPDTIKGFPVTHVGESAFKDCTTLTSVVIGRHVTIIEESAFQWCINLSNVKMGLNVTIIDDSAFHSCSSISSITIPASVTKISRHAFRSCKNLINLTIPENVTHIGLCAFADCTGLVSVTIPNCTLEESSLFVDLCPSLTIWDYGFSNCPNLMKVYFKGNAPTIYHNAFAGSDRVTLYYSPQYAGWDKLVSNLTTVRWQRY